MIERVNRVAGVAALCVSLLALVFSMASSAGAKHAAAKQRKPKPGPIVRLGKGGKIPAKDLPVVPHAKRADVLGADKATADDLTGSCDPESVDMGTWCLAASTYPLADDEVGKNDFFFATQKCAEEGGWLPSAAQLIGAAARVKLSSTIDDNQLTAAIDIDPTDGLKDKREMSSTLVTTAAGSRASRTRSRCPPTPRRRRSST
jgi:hypothetical protein